MKRPHKLDPSAFDTFFSDVLLGSGTGKRLVMRVFPKVDMFTYIVTTPQGETRHATFTDAVEAYNADCWD